MHRPLVILKIWLIAALASRPPSAVRQIVLPLAHLVMAYYLPTQRCVAGAEPVSFIQLKWTIT
jgi:hypothetical protein